MAGFQARDTMPKFGHVTDLREQWLVRTDGALAHRLQDREISSHLCENRYRNQQIREDFPVALHEQQGLEYEAQLKELARLRQAEIDAEIAREMAQINLRKQQRQHSEMLHQASSSCLATVQSQPSYSNCLNPEELGLSPAELEEIKTRMEQEERDAQLARELSHAVQGHDALLADMRCAVEAQDSELARLLQEREYKKLQRAKEKARQKAMLKKQQRLAAQQRHADDEISQQPTTLCDAYCNPRDMIRENRLRLSKSVDSDLNYVEPFEKEHIESKASALQAKEVSKHYYPQQTEPAASNVHISQNHSRSIDSDHWTTSAHAALQHRHPPPPPATNKKPRFPDPISIRPASHYPADNLTNENAPNCSITHSYSENNNLYSSTFSSDNDNINSSTSGQEHFDSSKRLSVISDITAESLAKKKNKQSELNKKRKGCKIQ